MHPTKIKSGVHVQCPNICSRLHSNVCSPELLTQITMALNYITKAILYSNSLDFMKSQRKELKELMSSSLNS
jgi:hypothetical protein